MDDKGRNVETKLFENLPMHLNLGDYLTGSHAGWATAFKNEETGETRIEIRLNRSATELLGDLVEVFELKAIGFAGYKRRDEDVSTER